MKLSTKHKHNIVRRIHTSKDISSEQKQEALNQLSEIDSSDWLEKTSYFSRAAIPSIERKRELWD